MRSSIGVSMIVPFIAAVALAMRDGRSEAVEGATLFVQRCYTCEFCSGADADKHKMTEVEGHNQPGKRYTHGCILVNCGHPGCTTDTTGGSEPGEEEYWDEGEAPAPTEIDVLIADAFTGDANAVTDLLTRFPRQVWYNKDRGALQFAGCSDQVVAGHLPLTTRQLAAVAAVEGSRRAVGEEPPH